MEQSDDLNKTQPEESTPKKQGGYRPNAGRKKGSGKEFENMVIRMPYEIKLEAELKEPNIKKAKLSFTKMIITGFKKELKKIPYPEGVEPPAEGETLKRPVEKKRKRGRPPVKK